MKELNDVKRNLTLLCDYYELTMSNGYFLCGIKDRIVYFDLYYRENCKSRPIWACDMGEFKKLTYFYCKNGKLSHIEPFHFDFVSEIKQVPEYCEEPIWVKFFYDERDPLSHQAKVMQVHPDEDMQVEK